MRISFIASVSVCCPFTRVVLKQKATYLYIKMATSASKYTQRYYWCPTIVTAVTFAFALITNGRLFNHWSTVKFNYRIMNSRITDHVQHKLCITMRAILYFRFLFLSFARHSVFFPWRLTRTSHFLTWIYMYVFMIMMMRAYCAGAIVI